MARRHDYVPPELDTRYGSSENYDEQAGDAAADWLNMNDPSIASERAINGDIEGEDINGISLSGLMEHRIKSMPTGVQQAVKAAFGGQLGTLESRIAAENFLELTGEDPAAFARRIKFEGAANVTVTTESGESYVTTPSSYSKADMRLGMGMFSEEGIAKYVNRGVGSSQEGNTYGVQSIEADYRASLTDAYATVGAIASRVIDPKVPQGAGWEIRYLQAQEELIKFGMEATGVNRFRMPNPNELRVRGRRSTIGRATGTQGTPFTPLEYDAAISEGGPLYGQPESETFKYIPSGYKSYGLEKDEFYEMQDAYNAAMKTIRQSTLTTSDEASGNIERLSGYQQTREDWDARANTMNEAAILDLDMYQPDFIGSEMALPRNLESVQDVPAMRTLKGSNTGGMYGEKGLSERDLFAENYIEDNNIDPFSEQGQYIARMQGAPEQGSAQWLAQRRQVDFTASTIGILGSKSGTDKLAINLRLAREKGITEGYDYLGKYSSNVNFLGNTYSKEGNEFESDVRNFFMAQVGKPAGLTAQEAFFERGEGRLANFGVTPDARLYDAEGKSAGLAEFKLKRGKAFGTVLEDYYDQVQLQMAVTGESQTHLFALEQHTDETVHHLIQADPERQEFLIAQANEAKVQADALTLGGTQALMKTIKGRKTAKANAVPTVAGEEARLETLGTTEGQEKPAVAFKPTGAASTVLAQKMEQDDQRERMKEALANAKGVDDISFIGPPESAAGAKARADLGKKRLKSAADLEQYRLMTADEVHGEGIKENEAYDREAEAQAIKKLADAASTTTGQLLVLAAGLGKVGKVLGSVADKFLGETAIDEDRLAAQTGADAGALRGMRVMLEQANVSKGAIDQTLMAGGQAQLALADPVTGGKFISDINVKMLRAASLNPELADFAPMNPADYLGMTAQQFIGMAVTRAEGLSPQGQQLVHSAYGTSPELGIADNITGAGIAQARSFMDVAGARAQNEGVMAAKEEIRRFEETTQTLGYAVGVTAATGKEVSNRLSVEGVISTAIQGIASGIGYAAEGNLKVAHPELVLPTHKSAIPSHSITAPPVQPIGKSKTDLTVNNYVTVDKDGNYDTTTEVDGEVDTQFGTQTGD